MIGNVHGAASFAVFYGWDAERLQRSVAALFVASLRGSHIARLVIKDNKVVGEERLFSDLHKRFRYITQGPDGALYAIIDDTDGKIFKISN